MVGNLSSYNADVLEEECEKCGAKKGKRCRGNMGSQVTAAHSIRVKAAGYKWDRETGKLCPLTST